MTPTEIETIIQNADLYLQDWGTQVKKNGKRFNWFDMSHLLGYLLHNTGMTKEQILEVHTRHFLEKRESA